MRKVLALERGRNFILGTKLQIDVSAPKCHHRV